MAQYSTRQFNYLTTYLAAAKELKRGHCPPMARESERRGDPLEKAIRDKALVV